MKLPFKNKVLLAPMEEVNDIAFRLLCKKAGTGVTYTGLTSPLTKKNLDCAISPEGIGNRRSMLRGSLKETSGCLLDDKPVLQLFATSTKGIKDFMKKYDKQVCMWDFNLGCPAVNARRRGFGAFLKDLKVIEKIMQEMRKNTKKPLGVKFRKSDIAFDILNLAEKYCDVICVHPRTQAQGYSGEPDVEFASKIKRSTRLPVIYSGNVDTNNCKQLLKTFDFVMVGRKAIGNPNIFAEISGNDKRFGFSDWLKLARKYKLPFRQIKFQAMSFSKGMKNSRKLRNKLSVVKSVEEIEGLMK